MDLQKQESLGFGGYSKKTFFKGFLRYIFSLLIFDNNIFKSETYKNYKIVFDKSKRSMVSPVSAGIEIPIIEKRTGQIISIVGTTIQLMDMETFETLDAPEPDDVDLKNKITEGIDVEYWKVLERIKIVRVK